MGLAGLYLGLFERRLYLANKARNTEDCFGGSTRLFSIKLVFEIHLVMWPRASELAAMALASLIMEEVQGLDILLVSKKVSNIIYSSVGLAPPGETAVALCSKAGIFRC